MPFLVVEKEVWSFGRIFFGVGVDILANTDVSRSGVVAATDSFTVGIFTDLACIGICIGRFRSLDTYRSRIVRTGYVFTL